MPALFALVALCAAASASNVVVVVPLGGGAPELARVALANEVRTAIGALALATAQPAKTTQQHLDTAQALGLACVATAAECAVTLGGLAAGDIVINGTVEAAGDAGKLRVSLRAFDVVAVAERGRSELVVDADAAGRAIDVRRLVVRLLAPARERGSVVVSTRPAGAAVLVDGVPRGLTPLAGPLAVTPGAHEVYVALAGYESHTDNVEVAFEGKVVVDVVLKKGAAGAPRAVSAGLSALKAAEQPVAVVVVEAPLSAPVVAARAGQVTRIAVYELKVEGVDPRIAVVVTDALAAELRKLQRVSVVSMDEVRAMLDLEAQKQMAGCSQESCLAEIAEALGVDGVIIGTLAQIKDTDQTIFGLRRIDQLQAKTLGQVSQRLTAAKGEEFLAAIGPAVEELFPGVPLKPGVIRGVAPELGLRLNPPPLPPVVFISTLAVTVVAGLGAAAALVVNAATWADVDATLKSATFDKPANGAAVAQSSALIDQSLQFAIGFGVGAGAGAVATTVVALFTDWSGEQ